MVFCQIPTISLSSPGVGEWGMPLIGALDLSRRLSPKWGVGRYSVVGPLLRGYGNAKSGVGIVIGQKTDKILHIGVRNKYCSACAQGIPPEKRVCFKHCDASSSEMETDILDGFLKAEQTNGVRYTRCIGDGDSFSIPDIEGECTHMASQYPES